MMVVLSWVSSRRVFFRHSTCTGFDSIARLYKHCTGFGPFYSYFISDWCIKIKWPGANAMPILVRMLVSMPLSKQPLLHKVCCNARTPPQPQQSTYYQDGVQVQSRTYHLCHECNPVPVRSIVLASLLDRHTWLKLTSTIEVDIDIDIHGQGLVRLHRNRQSAKHLRQNCIDK
jgi:hypothetical protein